MKKSVKQKKENEATPPLLFKDVRLRKNPQMKLLKHRLGLNGMIERYNSDEDDAHGMIRKFNL